MNALRANKKHILRRIDWILVAIVLALFVFGLIALASATSPPFDGEEDAGFFTRLAAIDWSSAVLQIIYFAVGVAGIIVLLIIDYNHLRDFSDIIFWVAIALLIAVKLFGEEINGTSGWFRIGSRGIQPAELCKVAIIIVLAKEFAARTEGKEGIQHFRDLLPILWRFALPFLLIIWQSDFGSAMVYAVVMFGLLFMSGTNWKIILVLLAVTLALLPLFWLLLQPYQKNRILSFMDPDLDPTGAGFQVRRAKIVGSAGGINGKGLFAQGLLTQQSGYLPEKQTDFIFASTTEAVGFVGGMIVILLYGLLIYRLIRLSALAKDDFGTYLILGVSFMLLFHIFENIGMNIGLMPVTGIPLPLMSYGGSSMLTIMLAIGLVLNVNMRRPRYNL